MPVDPIPEEVRAYLSNRFQVEISEPDQTEDRYVFRVPRASGIPFDIVIFRGWVPSALLEYLKNTNLEHQLDSGDSFIIRAYP